MRDLVLILPDLFLFDSDAASARGPGLARLRFARSTPLRGGWRGLLARGLGRADLVAVDPAEVVAAEIGASDPPGEGGGDPWLLSPLHLVPGLKTVHLAPGGLLRLPAEEAADLCVGFARDLGGDALRLRPARSAGFLLEGLDAAGALTVEPSRLLGGALDEALPGGSGGAALRAFLTECEMWLHALPLNRQRTLRGEPPVTTLWPWGGGQPLREPLAVSPGESRWPAVWSDDVWVESLGRLAGQTVEGLPAGLAPLLSAGSDAGCAVLPVLGRGIVAIDQDYILPAAEALRTGQLGRLTLAAGDRAVRVTAGDRHRFWRPARNLLEALLEGEA